MQPPPAKKMKRQQQQTNDQEENVALTSNGMSSIINTCCGFEETNLNDAYIKWVRNFSRNYGMRYKSDGKTKNGSERVGRNTPLYAVDDEKSEKSFPMMEIFGASGLPATLVVTLISAHEPFYPHPNRLKQNGDYCKSRLAVFSISPGETMCILKGLSIERTKAEDLSKSSDDLIKKSVNECTPDSLPVEAQKNIKTTELRLCFQLYIHESSEMARKFQEHKRNIDDRMPQDCGKLFQLNPYISDIISKPVGKTLVVTERHHTSVYANGSGGPIVMVMQKLGKTHKPLRAIVYDDSGMMAKINDPNDIRIVHQGVIFVNVPAYYDQGIESDTKVFIKFIVPFESSEEREKYKKENEIDEIDECPVNRFESEEIEFYYKPLYKNSQQQSGQTTEWTHMHGEVQAIRVVENVETSGNEFTVVPDWSQIEHEENFVVDTALVSQGDQLINNSSEYIAELINMPKFF